MPGELSKQREVELAKRIHLRDATETENVRARFLHERQIGRVARQFQREVGFDRRIHFARAAVINIPAAIRQLAFQDVANATLLNRIIHFTEPMHEEDVIGAESAIDEQLAAPMPIGPLLPEEVLLRARDCARDLGVLRAVGCARIRRRARQRDEVEGLRG